LAKEVERFLVVWFSLKHELGAFSPGSEETAVTGEVPYDGNQTHD
jgi:hypothetical protein